MYGSPRSTSGAAYSTVPSSPARLLISCAWSLMRLRPKSATCKVRRKPGCHGPSCTATDKAALAPVAAGLAAGFHYGGPSRSRTGNAAARVRLKRHTLLSEIRHTLLSRVHKEEVPGSYHSMVGYGLGSKKECWNENGLLVPSSHTAPPTTTSLRRHRGGCCQLRTYPVYNAVPTATGPSP